VNNVVPTVRLITGGALAHHRRMYRELMLENNHGLPSIDI
jgi:hypothetical protein